MSHTHRVNIATEREELKQKKLTDVFIRKSVSPGSNNNNRNDDRYILARRLTVWISRDLLPYSLIENKGFKDFWNSLHLDMPLPSPQTISIGALDDMYTCMHKELIRILGNIGGEQ